MSEASGGGPHERTVGRQINEALSDSGYEVAEGADDVRALIVTAASGIVFGPLCSGFGVLPGGARCTGCADCVTPNASSAPK